MNDDPTPAAASLDPLPPNFDLIEVFTALYTAAEEVEGARLDEEGSDSVTTAGLVKVLRGGDLPPARLRDRDVLAALTCEPQTVSQIVAKTGASARAVTHRLGALPAVVYAPQPLNRASLAWLDSPTIPPPDDAPIWEAIPLPPDTVPVADLAAVCDWDANALARYLALLDGVYVTHRDGALIVGRVEAP